MTTFKHALGYNKDGVLGVAGLLGQAAASKFLGMSILPRSFAPQVGKYLFTSDIESGATVVGDMTGVDYGMGGFIYADGGYHVAVTGSFYTPSGQSSVKYTKDGETWAPLNSVGSFSLIGTDYQAQLSGIHFDKASSTFYLFINSYTQGNARVLFTTTDFETFNELGVIPLSYGTINSYNFGYENLTEFGGSVYNRFGVMEDGTLACFATNGSLSAQALTSQDGATWTISNISGAGYNQFLISPPEEWLNPTSPLVGFYSDSYWSSQFQIVWDSSQSPLTSLTFNSSFSYGKPLPGFPSAIAPIGNNKLVLYWTHANAPGQQDVALQILDLETKLVKSVLGLVVPSGLWASKLVIIGNKHYILSEKYSSEAGNGAYTIFEISGLADYYETEAQGSVSIEQVYSQDKQYTSGFFDNVTLIG